MAHQNQHVEIHHAGDAHDLDVTVEDDDGTLIDLTGADVEWLLFENELDADADAVLTKTGTEGGTTDGVTFTAPTNGELTVNIATGDTEGLVTWTDHGQTEAIYYHRLRVTIGGDRATVFHGEFHIHR